MGANSSRSIFQWGHVSLGAKMTGANSLGANGARGKFGWGHVSLGANVAGA
jgi:hypothetical protein